MNLTNRQEIDDFTSDRIERFESSADSHITDGILQESISNIMDILGQPIDNAAPRWRQTMGYAVQNTTHPRSSATLDLTEDEIALAAMTPDDRDPNIDELTARILTSVDYYLNSTRENSGLYQMIISEPLPLRTARGSFFNQPDQPVSFLPRILYSPSGCLLSFLVESPVETNARTLEYIGFSEENLTSEIEVPIAVPIAEPTAIVEAIDVQPFNEAEIQRTTVQPGIHMLNTPVIMQYGRSTFYFHQGSNQTVIEELDITSHTPTTSSQG